MAKIDYDVGDLVVCVDARDNPHYPDAPRLKEGAVYSVLSFNTFKNPDFFYREFLGVFRGEVTRGCSFSAYRFRKLPKKSQEFFTGEMQEVQDLVPAE